MRFILVLTYLQSGRSMFFEGINIMQCLASVEKKIDMEADLQNLVVWKTTTYYYSCLLLLLLFVVVIRNV